MNGARRISTSTQPDRLRILGETPRLVDQSVEGFTIAAGEGHGTEALLDLGRLEEWHRVSWPPGTTEYVDFAVYAPPLEFRQLRELANALDRQRQRYFIRLETNSTALDDPVSGVIDSPSWLPTAISELDELARLSSDWDEYGGVAAPNSQAIENARRIIKVLHEKNLRPSGIAPCPEEGVTLSFLREERSAAIECYNTGEIIAVTSARDADPTVWSLNNDRRQLRTTVETIQVFLQGSGT